MSLVQPRAVPTDGGRPAGPPASRAAFFAAMALVAGVGLVGLVAGLYGPEHVLNHSFLWAPADGNHIPPGREHKLLWLARLVSACAGVLLLAGLFKRKAAENASGRLAGAFKSSTRELWAAVRHEVASFPAVGWLSLSIVTLLGAAVRIRYLFEPLRYDEAFTYCSYAARPLRAFLQDYSWPNNHLFHTILVHVSTRLFGPEPWAIRLPALIAGVLTIPVVGLLFGRMFSDGLFGLIPSLTGLVAAALVAGSSILIEYSVNARGYSIQVLIFLLLLALAIHLYRRASLAGWTLLVVLSSIGFFTIPTMLYPFGIVLGWIVLLAVFDPEGEPLRRILPRVLVAGVATVLLTTFLYSPILLYHGAGPLVGNQFVAPMSARQWAHGLPLAIERIWQHANRGLPLAVGVFLSAGVALYVLLRASARGRNVLLLLLALMWCPLLVTIQRVIPFTRVWVFLEPLYLALAAGGWVAVWQLGRGGDAETRGGRWMLVVVPAVVLIASAALVVRSGTVIGTGENFPQAAELARFFDANLHEGDRVLAIFPAEAPLRYQSLTHPALGRAMAPTAPGDRRLIIVIRPADQKPQDVLDELGVLTTGFDPPRLIHSIPGAAVYEMRRHGT